jgi:hemin uptake protein HemP
VELHSQQTKGDPKTSASTTRERLPISNNSNLDVGMSPEQHEKKTEISAPLPSARGSVEALIRYSVADLLQGRREAILEHDGAEYRLRITANGRLILTK